MKKTLLLGLPLKLCAAVFCSYCILINTAAAMPKPAPIVLELFTSQGCSSCPAADKYLAELSHHANTISIACHVTYWNYLGWSDTFSTRFCDKRQQTYNNQLGSKTNYTPQIIINGRYSGVGSQREKVTALLNRAANDTPIEPIDINKKSDALLIDSSAIRNKQAVELVIMGLLPPQTVAIKRGENSGRNITYHNPVAHGLFKKLEPNTPDLISENIEDYATINHWVVLVQDIKTGAILAAGEWQHQGE